VDGTSFNHKPYSQQGNYDTQHPYTYQGQQGIGRDPGYAQQNQGMNHRQPGNVGYGTENQRRQYNAPTNSFNQQPPIEPQGYRAQNTGGYAAPPQQYQQPAPLYQNQYAGPAPNYNKQSPLGPQNGNMRSAKTRSARPRSQSPKKNDLINPKSVPQLSGSPKLYEQVYKTSCSGNAPCATASYLCEDDGNASPRYIRMTTNAIPRSGEIAERAALVIGAVVQPFANIPEEEKTSNVITYKPVRCSTCQAYVNAHTIFLRKNRGFKCNLCYEENETPEYVVD